MTNLHRSGAFTFALAAALLAAPGVRGEKEKELLETRARAAYVTPDGKILAAASKDNVRVVYLDVKKSRLISKEYSPIALSPDGKFLLTVAKREVDDGLVPAPVIELATLKEGGALVISNAGIAFCLSPGGKMSAYGTRKDLVLADVASGKIRHTFTDTGGQPWSASFSPNGKYLACGTGSGTSQVVVWNTGSFKTERTFANMPGIIQAIAFSQDSKRLAASSDQLVKVWDLATGKEVRSFRGPKDKLMRGLAFGNSGKVLAGACSNGVVTLWDVATGSVLDTINVGAEPFRVSMSDDGRILAVTAEDEVARVYDISAATAGRGLLQGAGGATDATTSELKKLQGAWKVVSLTVAGKLWPAEQWKGLQIVIKDQEMDLMGKTVPFKIDPSTKPRSLDLTITRGDKKIAWKCIYSLEGDTLKLLMPLVPTKEQKNVGVAYGSVKRPESFAAENKPFMVFTAERENK